jgi:hypothetical protein
MHSAAGAQNAYGVTYFVARQCAKGGFIATMARIDVEYD